MKCRFLICKSHKFENIGYSDLFNVVCSDRPGELIRSANMKALWLVIQAVEEKRKMAMTKYVRY